MESTVQSNNLKLYNNIINSRKATQEEIGDFDTFNTLLKDSANAEKLYNNLIKLGRFSKEELGTEDEFLSNIDPVQPSQNKENVEKTTENGGAGPGLSPLGTQEKSNEENILSSLNQAPQQWKESLLNTKSPEGHVNPYGWQFTEDTGFGRGLKSAAKSAVGAMGTGLEEGALKINDLARKFSGNPAYQKYLDSQENRIKTNLQDIRDYEKDVPDLKGTWGEKLGGLVPFTGMVAASALTRSPALAEATTGMFGTMGFGEGIEAYDKYKEAANQPKDEGERLGAGLLYSAAMSLPLSGYLGKIMPKKLFQKAVSKIVTSDPEALGQSGKAIWENFVKNSPGMAEKVGQALSNVSTSTASMATMEAGKMAVDNYLTGRDVNPNEFWQRTGQALADGALFGVLTAPFGMYAQSAATKARREKQGSVILGMDKDNNPIEIIPTGKENIGMKPNGETVKVSEEEVKNSVKVPTDVFYKSIAKAKENNGKLYEGAGLDAVKGNLTDFANRAAYQNSDNIITYKAPNGDQYFVKDGDIKDPGADLTLINREGQAVKANIPRDQLSVVPKEDFINEGVNRYQGTNNPATVPEGQNNIQPSPEQARQADMTNAKQSVKDITSETGKIVAIKDMEGNQFYATTDPNNPDLSGMVNVVDENGNPAGDKGFIHIDKLDRNSIEEFNPEEMLATKTALIDQHYSQQNQTQQPGVGSTIKYKGGSYTIKVDLGDSFGLFDNKTGNAITVKKDEIIPPEQPGQPAQATKVETEKIGNQAYDFTEGQDGSLTLVPNEKMPLDKALPLLEKELKDNPDWEVVADKEQVEVPAQSRFQRPTQQTVVKNIQIRPKNSQVNPELKQQVEQETKPSYEYNGKEVSPDYVKGIIEDADSKEDLAGLTYRNDPEIDKLIEKKFPAPEPAYTIKGKKVSKDRALSRIDTAKSIEKLRELQVENDPETEQAYLSKTDEFRKQADQARNETNKKHDRLVSMMQSYNQSSPAERRRTNTQPVMQLASELGYNVKYENGNGIRIYKNGTEIRKTAERPGNDEILGHRSLKDYDQEVQDLASSMLVPSNVEGMELGGLAPKEVNQGILDIQAGKKTVTANRLLDEIENIHHSGVIRLKADRKTGFPGAEIPLEEYTSLINNNLSEDDRQKAMIIPEDVARSVNEGQLTPELLNQYGNIIFKNENKNGTAGEQTTKPETAIAGTGESLPETEKSKEPGNPEGEVREETGIKLPIEEALEKAAERTKIKDAEREANQRPTEAQKEAGNYKMGHVKVRGLDVTIENPKGSVRSGTDREGNKWSTKMNNTYGYIRGTKGKDGDHIDVFLGDNPGSDKVFVIDQVDPKTGKFDEHKAMIGFDHEAQAKEAYLSNYQPGWKGLGRITETSMDKFKEWAGNGTRKQKPFAGYAAIKENNNFVENATNEIPEQGAPRSKRSQDEVNSRMAEIASILGGNGEGGTGTLRSTRSSKSEQEEELKNYAGQSGIWFTPDQISAITSIKYPSGKEADVYVDKSNANIIKVVNYQKYSKTPLDFLNNRVLAFNELFPETAYNIIGFTNTDKGLSFVLSQPFVKGKLLSRLAISPETLDEQQNRISQYMKDKFGMGPAGLDAFENNQYKVEDLHLKNVIQGDDGNLYFIDAISTKKENISPSNNNQNDQTDIEGVQSSIRKGETPEQGQPVETAGGEKAETGRVLQTPKEVKKTDQANQPNVEQETGPSNGAAPVETNPEGARKEGEEISNAYGSREKQSEAVRKTLSGLQNTPLLRINRNRKRTPTGRETDPGRMRNPDSIPKVKQRTVFDGFKESGYVDVIGQKVNSPQDLADLWAIHRSPYIEKAHVIFVHDGVIVGSTATTLNQTGISQFSDPETISSLYKKYGANGMYFLHNHPSGNSVPSSQDIYVTVACANVLKPEGVNLLGHVVIDHNEFRYINLSGTPFLGNAKDNEDLEEYLRYSVERYEYKNPVPKLFSEREKLPSGGDAPKRLMEIAQALLNERGYNGAVIYFSPNLAINAYDPFPENSTPGSVAGLAEKGLGDHLGSRLAVIHDGSFDFSGTRLPEGTIDLINTGKGRSELFMTKNSKWPSLQTLWEQDEPYENKPKSLSEALSSKSYIPEKIKVNGIDRPARNSLGELIHPSVMGIKNFWKWFSDSEKAKRIEKLRNSKPIEITGKEFASSEDLKEYRANALEYGKSLRGNYTNKDTGEKVLLARNGIGEILRHDSFDKAHLQTIAAIPQIIENAIYIDTAANEDTEKHPNIKEYRYYVSGLKIGGADYTVKSVIAVDRDGSRYYDHSLTQIEKGKLLDEAARITSPPRQQEVFPSGQNSGISSPPSITSNKDKRLLDILQVKSSKVVDGQGRPLVVYHGTTKDFDVFGKGVEKKPLSNKHRLWYFTKDIDMANTFAGGTGSIMPVYLSIKNPRILSPEEKDVIEDIGYWATDEMLDQFEKQGYDGLMLNDLSQIVALNPSQIKSATENNGGFNPEDPSIVKESQPEYDKKKDPLRDIYNRIEDPWFGNRDIEAAKATIDATKQQDRIKKSFKGHPGGAKTWKDIDRAIHIYLDMLASPADAEKYWDKLNPGQKQLVNIARNLSPEQKKIAWDIRQEYDIIGQKALDEEIISNVLDNYVARSWDIPEKQATEFWRKFGTSTRHAKKRTLGTIIEGWANGYNLKIEGATNNLQILRTEINNVIENRHLMEFGLQLQGPEGEPLFTTYPMPGYEEIKHPNFRKWVKVKTVGTGSGYKGENFSIAEDGSVLERKKVYAPSKIARRLNNILGTSKGPGWVQALTRFNAVLKSTILSWSFFHHMAFARSYMLAGAAKWKNINPIKAYKDGLKSLYEMKPEVGQLIRNGLTVGRIQDWDEMYFKEKSRIGRYLDNHNILPAVRQKILNLHEQHTNFLFNKYGAGLKVKAALLEYKEMLQKHPEMDHNLIAKMVAELINNDFGGLHLQRMGRNPVTQHVFRLLALAPDWTESNIRTMVNAIAAGSREERHMNQKFWFRAFLRTAFTSVALNLLMALWDRNDKEEESYRDAVERIYKNAFEDPERLNWLSVDITPLHNALGSGAPEEAKGDVSYYFSILGHFKDPVKFIMFPLQSAKNKGSILTGTALGVLEGTNWQGKRYTTLPELLGIDNKGVYTRSNDREGYRVGEPKGGKLRGHLNKWGTPGDNGPLEWDEIPSFILDQLRGWTPVPVQNAMAYAMGDLDAFDALTHGIGFHVNKSARKDNLESDYNKIVQDATIHIRMVNDAINHQESEKAMELSKDSRMDDYMAIYMMDKNISNLRKMEQKSDDDGNFDKADELQKKIVEKMKEVINKYGKP